MTSRSFGSVFSILCPISLLAYGTIERVDYGLDDGMANSGIVYSFHQCLLLSSLLIVEYLKMFGIARVTSIENQTRID